MTYSGWYPIKPTNQPTDQKHFRTKYKKYVNMEIQ